MIVECTRFNHGRAWSVSPPPMAHGLLVFDPVFLAQIRCRKALVPQFQRLVATIPMNQAQPHMMAKSRSGCTRRKAHRC